MSQESRHQEEAGLVIFNPVRSLKCICMMYLLQYVPNNQLSNVCGDEERVRIDVEKSCSEPEIQMTDELTYAVENYEPNIKLSDVYDVAFYEGILRIDADKSCSEPEAHMTSEFKPADVHDIALNEKFMHLKQSAVKKNISNKNESSDEFEWPSSDSSDEGKKSPLDPSDDWKMPPHVSSDEWEMRSSPSSDKSETFTSPSNGSCNSSNSLDKNEVKELSEYEKKIQKNRDEKLAFLQSLKMNEVKEDLNEAIMNMKPPRKPWTKHIWPKHPTRKSVRLRNVHFDFSEQRLQNQVFSGIEEETKKSNTKKHHEKSTGKYKKSSKSKSYQVQDESESSDDLQTLSITSDDDNDLSECSHENEVKGDLNKVIRNPIHGSSTTGAETSVRRSRRLAKVNIDFSEEAFLARSLAAVRKEFKENKMKRKSAPDKSKKM